MTDYATTGDGLIAALQFLSEMARHRETCSELVQSFATVPQLLKNVRYGADKHPLSEASVKSRIAERRGPVEGQGPRADPQIRHRAADPRHGRMRG